MAVGAYSPTEQTPEPGGILAWLHRELLLVSTVCAVVLAITLALALRGVYIPETVLLMVELPGQIFISLLKMLVLPVMLASVVTGSASLSGRSEGRLALTTMAYFLLSSFSAAILGMILVVSIHPGHPDVREGIEGGFTVIPGDEVYHTRLLDTLLDQIRNAFPDNLVQACINQEYTQYDEQVVNATGQTVLKKIVSKRLGVNSLGLIIFCMIFGISMGSMGKQADLMKRFFICLDKLIMALTLKVLWMMPLGVLSLICAKFLGAGDLVLLVRQAALFLLTVLLGLAIQLFGIQTVVYWAIARKNPFVFMGHCLDAAITAFGVSSSSAAMPVTLRCLEERCGIDKRVSRFVIPIGVTVNMNGTALFITVATMFIAQMNSVSVGLGEVVALLITATAVSVATTSVPSASIFLMVVTLSVVGAPVSDITLLFATEWLLDRCRTVNNVLGDAFACGVVAHLCRDSLDQNEIHSDPAVAGRSGEVFGYGDENIPMMDFEETKERRAPIASL